MNYNGASDKTDLKKQIKKDKKMDEYDKALVFAMKKWISDEINDIYDNNIYAVSVTHETDENGTKVYIGYNTEDHLKATGGERYDHTQFKKPRFAEVDDNSNVFGSIDIWFSFKGYEPTSPGEDAISDMYGCFCTAFEELNADGIIKERFNKNMQICVSDGCTVIGA